MLMGFEALHGEVSMYIWLAVTPCVCVYLSGRFRELSCYYILYYRVVDFTKLGDSKRK